MCYDGIRHCLGYIGDHIPIWKDWLGGGALFTTIVAMLMASAHLIPEEVGENLSNFQSTVGWLDLYIIMLITGSLLAINRKILIRSFLGYIPCILAGVLGSFPLRLRCRKTSRLQCGRGYFELRASHHGWRSWRWSRTVEQYL